MTTATDSNFPIANADSLWPKVYAYMKTKRKTKAVLKRNMRGLHRNSIRPDEDFCGRQTKRILDTLREAGEPMTDRELGIKLDVLDRSSVAARICEAIKDGYLEECGDKVDWITGYTTRLVRPTGETTK